MKKEHNVQSDLLAVSSFLHSIGLIVRELPGATGFMPGLRISAGCIEIDPDKLAVEDLLHEAGHLATIPARYRHLAEGDLTAVQLAMGADIEASKVEIDSLLMRAILQTSDVEATAWAWAAGTHLGLAPECIISNDSYGGDGLFIRQQLTLKGYLGINGLRHAEMCARAGQGRALYPAMLKWTQDAGKSPLDARSAWGSMSEGRRNEVIWSKTT